MSYQYINSHSHYAGDPSPCGCFYISKHVRQYLPLVNSEFHSTVRSNTVQTALTQTFTNPTKDAIEKCKYTFPLYEGLSVVGFSCKIGDRILTGIVKEKEEAKANFDQAVSRGESAGLLEQSDEASDVFSTSLGNVAASQTVLVEIEYVAELKNDVDVDGVRLTIPTVIAPRYGNGPTSTGGIPAASKKGIKITVDIVMPEGSPIRSVQSPSHPISLELGVLSSNKDSMSLNKACATLSLGEAALEKDFVLMIKSEDTGLPKAILEKHPTLTNHRALCATLVPKFFLPEIRPMLKDAMKVFLKSLPVGTKFNICSFGSSHYYLWKKSKSYTQEHLNESLSHVDTFDANYSGTETLAALKATVKRRLGDIPLEMILLTDGDIWQQEEAFRYINEQVEASKGQIRLFPLGIGGGVSHALIEGLARAGRGFAQAVQDGERMDGRVVRMLRGALSPHITDYSLEIKYEKEDGDHDEFELVEKVSDSLNVMVVDESSTRESSPTKKQKTEISFFDSSADPDKETRVESYIPEVTTPKLLQAPHQIPSLFSFSRTTVYHLLSPSTIQRTPTSVVFRATSNSGHLSLEIPIQALEEPSSTIHQLAARKAAQDLEEGRGWLYDAVDKNNGNQKIKDKFPSRFDDLVKREAVRLGTTFQVANRWCSFVAVSSDEPESADQKNDNNLSFQHSHDDQFQQLHQPHHHHHQRRRQQHHHSPGFVRACRGGLGGIRGVDRRGLGRGGRGGSTRGGRGGGAIRERSFPEFRGSPQGVPMGAANGDESDSSEAEGFGLLGDASDSNNRVMVDTCDDGEGSTQDTNNKQTGGQGTLSKLSKRRKLSPGITSANAALAVVSNMSVQAVVHELVSLQEFEGGWSARDGVRLAHLMKACKYEDLAAGNLYTDADVDENMWMTALVIVFLVDRMLAEKDVWEMIVEKATVWLREQLRTPTMMEDVLEKARKAMDKCVETDAVMSCLTNASIVRGVVCC